MKKIFCDVCGGEPKFDGLCTDIKDKVKNEKAYFKLSVQSKLRKVKYEQSIYGYESFTHRIDGFPKGWWKRWKDFDLCDVCSDKLLSFMFGESEIISKEELKEVIDIINKDTNTPKD